MNNLAHASNFRTIRLADLPDLERLFSRIQVAYKPIGVFLYGSRARGEATLDSDWDVKVVVPDDASEELFSPMLGWNVQDGSGVYADVSCARLSEFEADLSVANSAAREVLRDGILIEAK